MPLIPLEDAWSHIADRLPRLPVQAVPLADALGLVTAEAVVAPEPVPPFDNTAVDGFAVRAADVATAPVTLEVVGTVAAGSPGDVEVRPGTAVRIMTGAPVPPGADAIVMVEHTTIDAGGAEPAGDGEDRNESVTIGRSVGPGQNIRPTGDDLAAGDPVVGPGIELTAGHLGLLATVGRSEVAVHRRPRVGVISTGDELVGDGSPLAPGQIRDSNRLTLIALCRQSGFDTVDLGLIRDDEAAIEAALRAGSGDCDAILSSGGVSMGDFDYVKSVLERIGDMRWMQIAIRPAKPLAFGLIDGVPVFGLPGNPVSSMVSFELFARPGIRAMAGHADLQRRRVRAIADQDFVRRSDGKVHFARVVVDQDEDNSFHVASAGGQGSHQLSAMATANGLAVLPDGDGVRQGGGVDVILLG